MIIKFENIENLIIELRDQKVLIDSDVAKLYGVETKRVNEAVKNNPDKFPDGYFFELNDEEFKDLRSKKTTTNFSKRRYNPKAFTEKGLYMLATILKSPKATEATISIIETFAKIKKLSRNINEIMNTEDKNKQKKLAEESNQILEDIIEIEPEIIEDDKDSEIIETTTKFEFNLGFAKVSKSIKKIKK